MPTPKGRYLVILFAFVICGGLLARVLRARAENGVFDLTMQTAPPPPDSASARAFLAGVRGATPLICALAAQGMDNHWSDGAPDISGELGSDSDLRALLSWASRDINSAQPVPILRAGISDADPCVRTMAARLLGRTRDPAALAALIPALSDQKAETRTAAALGLGFGESARAIDPLSSALKDATASVRATAAWALGRIEDHRPVPALGTLLSDSDAGVRRNAAWALGHIEDARAIEPLTSTLQHDSDASVRRTAAWALGNIK